MDSSDGQTNSVPRIPAGTAAPDPRRWLALTVLCAATFIIILDGSIVFVAAPSIAMDLQLTPSGVQWVFSSFLLCFGGLLLLGGRAADLLGRRRVFIAGGILLAVSSLFCGLAESQDVLIAARAFQGLAAAIMTPTALSILTTTFKEGRERNKALGFWSTAGGVGGTTGALLGGPLTEGPGWGWIFYVNIPVAVLMVALAPFVLRESYDKERARSYDVAGALTSTAAMVLLVYAVVDAPVAGWSSGKTIGKLVAAAVLFLVFVAIEKRSKAPLAPLHVFKSKWLVGGNIVLLAVGMAVNGAMGFVATQYAQVVLGYSAVEFGFMFAVMTVLTIVGSMAAGGPLVNRFGPRPVAAIASVLVGIGCFALTRIDVDGSYWSDLFFGMAIFGPGLGAGFVAASIASLAGVADREAGLASGLNNAAFHVGGALGIAILSSVVASQAVGPTPPVALTEGFKAAAGVSVLFAALGLAAALLLLGRRRSTQTADTPDVRAVAGYGGH